MSGINVVDVGLVPTPLLYFSVLEWKMEGGVMITGSRKSKLKAEDAALAGEMSGHMFFADRHFGFDDAIYASFRLLEIVSNQKFGFGPILWIGLPLIPLPRSDSIVPTIVNSRSCAARRSISVRTTPSSISTACGSSSKTYGAWCERPILSPR